MSKRHPTIEELHERLTYDPETGLFRWKRRDWDWQFNSRFAGHQAFTGINSRGYCKSDLKPWGRFTAHRVAWAMHYGEWPEGSIDHINGVKTDNRIENLRLCFPAQNNANRPRQSNGKYSRFKGVSWHKKGRKFSAQIGHGGRLVYLGLSLTLARCGEVGRRHPADREKSRTCGGSMHRKDVRFRRIS